MQDVAELTAAEIGVGYGVWEKVTGNYDPRGGTVVDVSEVRDAETGEVRRAWTAVDFRRGKLVWVTLRDDQVSTSSCHAPNSAFIRPLIRRICGEVSSGKSWSEWDRKAIRAAYHLAGVIE